MTEQQDNNTSLPSSSHEDFKNLRHAGVGSSFCTGFFTDNSQTIFPVELHKDYFKFQSYDLYIESYKQFPHLAPSIPEYKESLKRIIKRIETFKMDWDSTINYADVKNKQREVMPIEYLPFSPILYKHFKNHYLYYALFLHLYSSGQIHNFNSKEKVQKLKKITGLQHRRIRDWINTYIKEGIMYVNDQGSLVVKSVENYIKIKGCNEEAWQHHKKNKEFISIWQVYNLTKHSNKSFGWHLKRVADFMIIKKDIFKAIKATKKVIRKNAEARGELVGIDCSRISRSMNRRSATVGSNRKKAWKQIGIIKGDVIHSEKLIETNISKEEWVRERAGGRYTKTSYYRDSCSNVWQRQVDKMEFDFEKLIHHKNEFVFI